MALYSNFTKVKATKTSPLNVRTEPFLFTQTTCQLTKLQWHVIVTTWSLTHNPACVCLSNVKWQFYAGIKYHCLLNLGLGQGHESIIFWVTDERSKIKNTYTYSVLSPLLTATGHRATFCRRPSAKSFASRFCRVFFLSVLDAASFAESTRNRDIIRHN